MLLEVTKVRQVPGELGRRWFFSHEQDLMMWFGDDGSPAAFQLSYGKYRNEHTIHWKAAHGFTHYSVDDGESGAVSPRTPLLTEGGVFPAARVLERFMELSTEMPHEIRQFVAARLREHPDYGRYVAKSRLRRSAVPELGMAIGLSLSLFAIVLLMMSRRRPARGRS